MPRVKVMLHYCVPPPCAFHSNHVVLGRINIPQCLQSVRLVHNVSDRLMHAVFFLCYYDLRTTALIIWVRHQTNAVPWYDSNPHQRWDCRLCDGIHRSPASRVSDSTGAIRPSEAIQVGESGVHTRPLPCCRDTCDLHLITTVAQ